MAYTTTYSITCIGTRGERGVDVYNVKTTLTNCTIYAYALQHDNLWTTLGF